MRVKRKVLKQTVDRLVDDRLDVFNPTVADTVWIEVEDVFQLALDQAEEKAMEVCEFILSPKEIRYAKKQMTLRFDNLRKGDDGGVVSEVQTEVVEESSRPALNSEDVRGDDQEGITTSCVFICGAFGVR